MTHRTMHVYFPTQVPQQAIGTADFVNSICVKTQTLELVEKLEGSQTIEPGTNLLIAHWWLNMITLGTEPCINSRLLPQTRLARIVQTAIEQFIIFLTLCDNSLEIKAIIRNHYGRH